MAKNKLSKREWNMVWDGLHCRYSQQAHAGDKELAKKADRLMGKVYCHIDKKSILCNTSKEWRDVKKRARARGCKG